MIVFRSAFLLFLLSCMNALVVVELRLDGFVVGVFCFCVVAFRNAFLFFSVLVVFMNTFEVFRLGSFVAELFLFCFFVVAFRNAFLFFPLLLAFMNAFSLVSFVMGLVFFTCLGVACRGW